MKRRKIVWILLIFVLLVIVGLYFSRNQWAGYLLKKQVSGQTNGNVTLSFKAIHIDVFKKRLIVLDPSLTYKNTYLDREHARDNAGEYSAPRFVVAEDTLAPERSPAIDRHCQNFQPTANQDRAHVRKVCRQEKIEDLN